MSQTFTHYAKSTNSYAHHLISKTAVSNEVLIITSYDYFLEKRGLSLLIKKYKEIILVPRIVDDDYLINQIIRPLLEKYSKLHLVTNPQYDSRLHVIYELVISNNKSIRITTVYDFCEKILHKVYVPDKMDEMNPIMPEQIRFDKSIRVVKVIIDFLISLALLVGSLPLWAISAFRIRQESPGPIFYQQNRVGINQSIFSCVKFRSMSRDSESQGPVFSLKKDSRTFRYGALMRLTRIDELPQLFNIFRGELSLIGPRPERPVFTETFEEMIPYYHLRHCVKPGISGYAQVMYPYGSGAYDARHKLMYDLYYIKNWTILLELKIIFLTAYVVLTCKGR